MSYENLEAAILKRLQKEADDKASKSRRRRKCKGEAKKAWLWVVVKDVVRSEVPRLTPHAIQADVP